MRAMLERSACLKGGQLQTLHSCCTRKSSGLCTDYKASRKSGLPHFARLGLRQDLIACVRGCPHFRKIGVATSISQHGSLSAQQVFCFQAPES